MKYTIFFIYLLSFNLLCLAQNETTNLDSLELFNLSTSFNNPDSISFNKEKGLLYLKKSAEKGYYKAMQRLGEAYYFGTGCNKNDSLALYWLMKKYNLGKIPGDEQYYLTTYYIGHIYYNNESELYDINEAIKYFEACTEAEMIPFANLDTINPFMQGLAEHRIKANEQLQRECQALTHYELGMIYYNNNLILIDHKKAFTHFKKSAELGNMISAYFTAIMYYKGEGTLLNYYEAFKWMKTSATKGYNIGQYTLGVYYYFGIGTNEDKHQAASWVKKSFENGLTEAKDFWNEYRLWEY